MTSRADATIWHRLCRDRRGAALVEFGILAPVLIVLALGVMEFGWALQSFHVVDKGVRDAARYLARQTTPACGGAVANTTQAKNLAMFGNTAGSGNPVLSYWTDPNTITVNVSCVATSSGNPAWISPNGGAQIPIVSVTAAVPYRGFGFFAVLGLNSPTLTLQHQEISIPE